MIQVLGLFTKNSYLPFLIAPAILVWLRGPAPRWPAIGNSLAVFAGVPALLATAFVWSVPGIQAAGSDAVKLFASWDLSGDKLLHFAVEMVLLFQLLPLLLVLRFQHTPAPPERLGVAVLWIALVYTLALWSFGLPAVPRLYLPTLFVGMAVLTSGLEGLGSHRLGGWLLAGHLAANYGIGIVGLLMVWQVI